jgi:polysaccharide export outer membrane protein
VKIAGILLAASLLFCEVKGQQGDGARVVSTYRLGSDDQISIRVADLDKLQLENTAAPRVDVNGNLNLPVIGHVHASGLTLNELEKEIASRLDNILQNPKVSVSIVQYRSHPVSVLGAVRNPGVLQVTQPRRLLEVLSLAGGLAPDAGAKIMISRQKSIGMLPLSNAVDSAADYYLGSVDLHALMQANQPELNFEVLENDVITVPRAELVYVIGAVKKAGGFTLGEREQMSVLQALSLAEGLDHGAAPKSARLLREVGQEKKRKEIPINLKPIMAGLAPDVSLRANDIIFIPSSATKLATMRGIEAAINLGTGMAVWH